MEKWAIVTTVGLILKEEQELVKLAVDEYTDYLANGRKSRLLNAMTLAGKSPHLHEVAKHLCQLIEEAE